MMKVWITGYVWPEVESSAAGFRTQNLVDVFKKAGWEVFFQSGSKPNSFSEGLKAQGVEVFHIKANDSEFDRRLKQVQPDIVIFDRFLTEEQFGWRVRETCPQVLRVIDTQDLHFLRRIREESFDKGPDTRWPVFTETVLRELSSFYRSDLTLVLSDFEMNLLQESYSIPRELLFLHRFCYLKNESELPSYSQRQGFTFIGNFRHAPNLDAIHWFKREIWPLLHQKLPEAFFDLYGAYIPKTVAELHSPDEKFFVKGWSENSTQTLKNYRVSLAPLRFGAGIKGKISDSWSVGTPVVSTPIGAEGMTEKFPFGGSIAESKEEFVREAFELYRKEETWTESSLRGKVLIQSLYDFNQNAKSLVEKLEDLLKHREELRKYHTIGQILWYQGMRSTEYFSRWIELKEKVKSDQELRVGKVNESSYSTS